MLLAVLLTLGAAMLLSLSLILQRYALSHPNARIPVLCVNVPRDALWFVGLVLYGGANGLKVVALQFGPLSVLASIFTTVLVFNLILARLLLHEALTAPKVVGAIVIVGGATVASVGSCRDCQTQFSAHEITQLASAAPPGGPLYIGTLCALILGCVVIMCQNERRHPLPAPSDDRDQPLVSSRAEAHAWHAGLMALVYAGSLGLDEALADLLIKSWTGILALCGEDGSCGAWILWVSLAAWVVSAFASALWWYRKVLRRYETTVALPIEYGALNAASACTGLLFFNERLSLSSWQLACNVGGVATILVGIALGMVELHACRRARRVVVDPETSRAPLPEAEGV